MGHLRYLSSKNTKGAIGRIHFSYYTAIMGTTKNVPDFSEILKIQKIHIHNDLELFNIKANLEGLVHFEFDPKCFRFNQNVMNEKLQVNPNSLNSIVNWFSKDDRLEPLYDSQLNRTLATYNQYMELNGFLFTLNPVVLGLNTFHKEDIAKLSQDFPYSGRFILNDSVKGISFYLSYRRYQNLIKEGKIKN